MKRFAAGVVLSVMVISGFSWSASMDPIWLYKDLPDVDRIYGIISPFDTCRTINDFGPVDTSDTGDVYDGKCINLDYQFSADSFYHASMYRLPDGLGGWDTFYDTIYRDYRPGYAGYKIDWDHGACAFLLPKYKYLVMAHKGPLAAHKVIVNFGYNAGCGSPTTFQTVGSFTASPAWRLDTIAVPDSITGVPDTEVYRRGYYEMQVIINNADPTDTNKSSLPGNFKVDDIMLYGRNPINSSPQNASVIEGESVTFQVEAKPTDTTNPADTLTYQWKKNGVDIQGANAMSLTISSVGPSDAGDYSVAVTTVINGLSFTSKTATLTVDAKEEEKGCGCGAGTGAALLPPVFFRFFARRKYKRKLP